MDTEDDIQLEGYGSENAALDHAFRIIDEAAPPRARWQGQLVVCPAADLPPGGKRIVQDPKRNVSLGVFNVAGRFFALRNVCPHQGAPLCLGSIHAPARRVVRVPP